MGIAVREHHYIAARNSCTEGPSGMPAQQLPCATAWYSITVLDATHQQGRELPSGGASAAQSLLPLTKKNTAPHRRTPRSTSDSVS